MPGVRGAELVPGSSPPGVRAPSEVKSPETSMPGVKGDELLPGPSLPGPSGEAGELLSAGTLLSGAEGWVGSVAETLPLSSKDTSGPPGAPGSEDGGADGWEELL